MCRVISIREGRERKSEVEEQEDKDEGGVEWEMTTAPPGCKRMGWAFPFSCSVNICLCACHSLITTGSANGLPSITEQAIEPWSQEGLDGGVMSL